jgi:hypothetical protein
MNAITVTAELKELLKQATGPVELRDEKGFPLGTFEPTERGAYWPITDEEMAQIREARKNPQPGRTLDEILKEAGLM